MVYAMGSAGKGGFFLFNLRRPGPNQINRYLPSREGANFPTRQPTMTPPYQLLSPPGVAPSCHLWPYLLGQDDRSVRTWFCAIREAPKCPIDRWYQSTELDSKERGWRVPKVGFSIECKLLLCSLFRWALTQCDQVRTIILIKGYCLKIQLKWNSLLCREVKKTIQLGCPHRWSLSGMHAGCCHWHSH